jgi:hypothetical protein
MIVVVANDARGCWIEFVGSVAQAEAKYRTVKVIDGHELGPMATKAQERPFTYHNLESREQWRIDKELGILDWDGEPTT